MPILNLPPTLDLNYYRTTHSELNFLSDAALTAHYEKFAEAQGLSSCPYDRREYLQYFLQLEIDKRHLRVLEISPWNNPFLKGDSVKYFEVADITGAYIAGVILCQLRDSEYISEKMDINSYMLFGPVFFCSIGLQTDMKNIDSTIIVFSLCFVAVGLISKIIGCGAIARLCGYRGRDTLKIGCGMMTRGEVALIVAQRGLSVGMMDHRYFTAVILLIIISSIITPLLLKYLYSKDPAGAEA